MRKIVYQPDGFSIGDAMPYYEEGVFYFYHYKHKIETHESAQNWSLSTTKDFIHYVDHGELFRHGEKGEQDYIFRSGTLLKKDDKYHFFYGGDIGVELVLHAKGKDIKDLRKDDLTLPIEKGYGPAEWRDPFVCWCTEIGAYLLILGTRKTETCKYLNGCTVWFTSPDLKHWTFKGDFWAPDQYTTHEMPDLFKIGEWWYLLVSEYSDNTQVIYRRSRSIAGPWEETLDDTLDSSLYFAGRTTADREGNRFLAGWIGGRRNRDDRSICGGDAGMWIHRIYQREDGSLGVALPDSVYTAFNARYSLGTLPLKIAAPYGRNEKIMGSVSASQFMIEVLIEVEDSTKAFSINILENEKTGEAYEYKFFISKNRFAMSRSPNHGITPEDHFRGMEKLSRDYPLAGKKEYRIQIIYDDTFAILYLDGTALSGRMYSRFGESVSGSVFNGSIIVKEFFVREGLRYDKERT
jgi:beta-fructofuranosidase